MVISRINISFHNALLTIAVLLAAMATPHVAAEEFLCHKISLEQNLSHSNVTAISRDGRGFLWIGTRFGLNRYDFENTSNYYHIPADDSSLPGNSIEALHTDSRGNLWVATELGAARYNSADNAFERLFCDGSRLNAKSFLDETNGILIGEIGKIFYYDYLTGSLTQLQTKGGSKYPYVGIYRRSPNSYILVTRWDGLWLFDRTLATITRFPGIPEKNITACEIDSNGVLYYSPYGEGLRACDRAGTPIFSFTTSNSPLPNNIVLDLCEHEGRIWVATDGGGVAIYNPTRNEFESAQPYRFLSDLGSVTTLYTDAHNNIYAGTVREGAVCVQPTALRTIQYSNNRQPLAMSSLCYDGEGHIWMGCDGHGVMRYDDVSEKFTHIPSTANLKVTDICEHDHNNMLLSTFTDGFFLLNKATGKLAPAPTALTRYWQTSTNRAVTFHIRRLAPNNIAVISDHIATYNPNDGTITKVNHAPTLNPGAMIPFFCQDGRLLCYAHGSIVDFDPVTLHMAEIYNLEEDGQMFCAAYDGYNSLYLSTDKGVICHNISSGTDSRLDHISDRVSSISCEPSGRVWLATTRAIHMLDPNDDTRAVFGLRDGIVPNEYIGCATLNCPDGLLLGGIYGLVRIQSAEVSEILSQHHDPQISLADLKIDGKSVYNQITDGSIEVPVNFSSITLSSIDNSPDSQRFSQFRFIVKKGNETRVAQSDTRTVDLSFLKSGEQYDVALSCLRPDGSWTSPHKLVHLAVMSPWFKSSWMWAVGGGILLILWGLWEYKARRQRKIHLQQQLDSYRSGALEREIAFLVNTNYALRTPLTMVYAPLKLTLERLRRGDHADLLPELERVYQNTKKMRNTIDMALELHEVNAKPDAGNLHTHDICRSISDSIKAVNSDIASKHINLTVNSSADMFPATYDRERIGNVLQIFLRNAIQRSSEQSSIEINISKHDELIHVDITDFGENINPDILPDIFSQYFTLDQTEFENCIEFAYAKNIIELHHGIVGAQNNTSGTGLTVWFELPPAGKSATDAYTNRRRNEALEPPTAIEPVATGVDTSAMAALVVESDNDLCLFISAQLSEYFGKVYHSFNGKDALLMTKQYQPDIVISALRLPGMSGLELCQAIKRSNDTNHIPVILLTALKEGSTHENAYEAGADSYLSKPFDLNILMARCRNILHTRSIFRKRYAELPRKEEKTTHTLSNADESFLIKVNKIISDNISNPDFDVNILVERMATSRSALYTKFKEITGRTLGTYISEMRIQKACSLLRDSSYSITEISDMLGFSSQRYFSTFFKARTGQTPSDYRSNPPEQ